MTTKKTDSKKETNKKVVKKEVKTETKKVEKKTFKDRLKSFFNSPQPLFVVFILIIIALLIYNVNYSKHDSIYVGHYVSDNGSISTVHVFTNHKINVFYASPASYEGEDVELYGYELGYYYEFGDKLKPIKIRKSLMEKPVKLSQIVSENSYFNIAELSTSKSVFTDEMMDNLDKLHFVVYGVTQKDTDLVDYTLDFKIEFDHIV